MKKIFALISLMSCIPAIGTGQNEFYVSTLVEELMSEELFQWASSKGRTTFEPDFKIPSDNEGEFINLASAKKIAERINLLTDEEREVLNALFQLYFNRIAPAVTLDYAVVKRIIKKLDPNAKLQSGSSPVGFGVSQAEVLTAIADVVIERAKQELAKMYFDKLADKIDRGIQVYYGGGQLYFSQRTPPVATHTIDLESMFPNIYAFLRNSADRMTPEMGQTFKNAFTKDLETLLPNVIAYALPDAYKNEHLVDDFVLSSYTFIMTLIGNAGFYVASDELFASLIDRLPQNNLSTPGDMTAVITVLQTVRVLNSSLVNNNGTYEVNAATFRNINPATFALYLNFLSGNPNLPSTIRTLIQSRGNKDHFNSFIGGVDKMRATLVEISNMETAQEKINAISLACHAFFDAFESALIISNDVSVIAPSALNHLRNIADNGRRSVEFASSLYTQDYANSALVVLRFIQSAYSGEMNKDLFKYVTLISDISHAQDAHEVRNIIDRAILPVGSYAIKQSTRFSVAINAYAGVGGGLEYNKFGNQSWSGGGGALGFALPIGVSVSWSRGNEDYMRHSNTIFASLLDLGAIANYNFGKTEIEQGYIATAPEITFANVFSPGISYIYALKKSPIAVLIGAQYMPRLREIKDANHITLGEADAVQLKLGFLVDVPLFNIVMKGRR